MTTYNQATGMDAAGAKIRERLVMVAQAGLDFETFCQEAMAQLRRTVPFDAWCVPTADPATLLVGRSVNEGIPPADASHFFAIEYGEDDFDKFDQLARRHSQATALTRSTRGDLRASSRWRDFFGPLGLGDELRAALISRGTCWGYLALHRERSSRSFHMAEIDLVTEVSSVLAAGLRSAVVPSKLVNEPSDEPALMILGPNSRIMEMTPASRLWLAEASNTKQRLIGELPDPVYAVVSRLRAAARRGTTARHSTSVQLHGRSGRWVVVQAAPIMGPSNTGKIAVMFRRPHPKEMVALVARASALTRREAELMKLVLEGLSTAEIADQMHISGNTVQDHAQATFAKLGVNSRRALVGRVLAGVDPGRSLVT